jgi:hypothetical protein
VAEISRPIYVLALPEITWNQVIWGFDLHLVGSWLLEGDVTPEAETGASSPERQYRACGTTHDLIGCGPGYVRNRAGQRRAT